MVHTACFQIEPIFALFQIPARFLFSGRALSLRKWHNLSLFKRQNGDFIVMICGLGQEYDRGMKPG